MGNMRDLQSKKSNVYYDVYMNKIINKLNKKYIILIITILMLGFMVYVNFDTIFKTAYDVLKIKTNEQLEEEKIQERLKFYDVLRSENESRCIDKIRCSLGLVIDHKTKQPVPNVKLTANILGKKYTTISDNRGAYLFMLNDWELGELRIGLWYPVFVEKEGYRSDWDNEISRECIESGCGEEITIFHVNDENIPHNKVENSKNINFDFKNADKLNVSNIMNDKELYKTLILKAKNIGKYNISEQEIYLLSGSINNINKTNTFILITTDKNYNESSEFCFQVFEKKIDTLKKGFSKCESNIYHDEGARDNVDIAALDINSDEIFDTIVIDSYVAGKGYTASRYLDFKEKSLKKLVDTEGVNIGDGERYDLVGVEGYKTSISSKNIHFESVSTENTQGNSGRIVTCEEKIYNHVSENIFKFNKVESENAAVDCEKNI